MTKQPSGGSAVLACIGFAAAIVLLAGCATPEEIKAADRAKCAGYGFSAGSDGFANCMMKAETNRERKDDEWFRDQNQRMREEEAAKARR